MEHVVFYRGADGAPAHLRAAGLDEALAAVERLRNEQGVDDPELFGLTAVPLSFTPYYRVQVGELAAGAGVGQAPVATPASASDRASEAFADSIWDAFTASPSSPSSPGEVEPTAVELADSPGSGLDLAEPDLAEPELAEPELAELELAEPELADAGAALFEAADVPDVRPELVAEALPEQGRPAARSLGFFAR